MMVLCFVVIDLIMLVVFSTVEGIRGNLGAKRVLDEEHEAVAEGVRLYSDRNNCLLFKYRFFNPSTSYN